MIECLWTSEGLTTSKHLSKFNHFDAAICVKSNFDVILIDVKIWRDFDWRENLTLGVQMSLSVKMAIFSLIDKSHS